MSRIIKVGLLTSYLREMIEADDVLQDVWVEGEISTYTVPASGHAYFSVKDERSTLSCVMWKSARARQRSRPAMGDQVVVHGSVTVYEAQGRYQLTADVIHPAGAGVIQLRLEQLRQRLEAEGLFDPSRKRSLPAFPERIGVITSSTGAVWHDIQHVTRRRYPLVELVLAPAIVQGEHAPASIVRALGALQDEPGIDLIVLARGGGSSDDLGCFNDERVARAVFGSRVPIVSAVGHETDTTIVDYVADVRAPTPSAAGEMVTPDITELRDDIRSLQSRAHRAASSSLRMHRSDVRHVRQRLAQSSPAIQLGRVRADLATSVIELRSATERRLERLRHDLDRTDSVLHALSPDALLRRGYAFMEHGTSGEPVTGVRSLRPGDAMRATFADGHADASVIAVVAVNERVR